MKEIDFLPTWYKQRQSQQISYRTKYVILGGIFFVIMTLNLSSSFTLFRAKSLIAKTQPQVLAAEKISHEYSKIKAEIDQIKGKEELLTKLDSKINVPNLLAEISYLVDEKMAIDRLELTSEKFDNKPVIKKNKPATAVRTAVIPNSDETEELYPDVRFKILISGVAAGGSDVARLVCKLEDSKYFRNVVLVGSKPKNIKIAGTAENCQVNEFQINCYLANYEDNEKDNVAGVMPQADDRIK